MHGCKKCGWEYNKGKKLETTEHVAKTLWENAKIVKIDKKTKKSVTKKLLENK